MSLYRADIPQDCMIHRPAAARGQNPPVGQQNVIQNNNVVNNILQQRMNPAERLGVNAVYDNLMENFRQSPELIQAPYNDRQVLQRAIYYGLREIDSLQGLGHNLHNILSTENLVRRISTAAHTACEPIQPHRPFEHLAFDVQIFFINLACILVRNLIRQDL